MSEIVFDATVPPELRSALQPLLDEFKYLVPTWCHTVNISNSTEAKEEELACAQVLPEYRQAFICFSPLWIEAREDLRRDAVLHEILHISIEPMRQVLIDLLDSTYDDDRAGAAHEQWRKAFEGTVCDLSRALRCSVDAR